MAKANKIEFPPFDGERDIKIAYRKQGDFINVYLVKTFTDENGEMHDYALQIAPAFPQSKDGKKNYWKTLRGMAGAYDGKAK